jgi:hypothetical protein
MINMYAAVTAIIGVVLNSKAHHLQTPWQMALVGTRPDTTMQLSMY